MGNRLLKINVASTMDLVEEVGNPIRTEKTIQGKRARDTILELSTGKGGGDEDFQGYKKASAGRMIRFFPLTPSDAGALLDYHHRRVLRYIALDYS